MTSAIIPLSGYLDIRVSGQNHLRFAKAKLSTAFFLRGEPQNGKALNSHQETEISVWCWRRSEEHLAGHVALEMTPGQLTSVREPRQKQSQGEVFVATPDDVARVILKTANEMREDPTWLADVYTFCFPCSAAEAMRAKLEAMRAAGVVYAVRPTGSAVNCAIFCQVILGIGGVEVPREGAHRRNYIPYVMEKALAELARGDRCRHRRMACGPTGMHPIPDTHRTEAPQDEP